MARSPLDQSDSVNLGAEAHLPEPLPSEPFGLFAEWFDDAERRRVQPNPNAMTVATVDGQGRPSASIVLCKAIDARAGAVVFYTNYRGRKGRELDVNPRAAAVFHWDTLDRQVRLEGIISRSPDEESDAYFRSRPWISRLGAWASDQSEPIADRDAMQAKLEATFRRFGLDPDNPPPADARIEIPRPSHWGGYRLLAERVELWVAGTGRLHDRASWERGLRPESGGGYRAAGEWKATRLQP